MTVDAAATGPAAQTVTSSKLRDSQGLSRYVDPFIGVDHGGNVFPGPTLPFGMVKLGPDTDRNGNAGYTSDGKIVGFSHLHVSGTGGGPKYGVVLLMPTTGPLKVEDYGSERANESASVGYYGVELSRYKVKAELTASRRVGVHRYTFLAGGESHILLDVGHFLSTEHVAESQRFAGGRIVFTSNHSVEGYGNYEGGWNLGKIYSVYFCVDFDTPSEGHGIWTGATTGTGNSAAIDLNANLKGANVGQPVGAFLNYTTKPGQVINAKVGISFVSTAEACSNLKSEVPDWNFERVQKAAVAAWDAALAPVTVEGGTEDLKRAFYTALYHSMLMPVDRTGENPLWQSREPYYDDFYTIWDTFRTTSPLLTLIHPKRESDIVRSLVDIYRHEGYLPDGRSGNDNGRTQGGSNAEVVIADAFVKGLKGIDYNAAYQAMVKDAEVPPAHPTQEGRGGLLDYKSKGYVSRAYERSGNRTVEYSYNDFAIAEVAKGLGRSSDYAKYLRRANNWTNLWDASLADSGVKGFIRPRNPDGSWMTPFNIRQSGTWPDYFYEADSWEYSLYAPQDVRQLMERSGGKEKFVERLDLLFDQGHIDIGDEPAFLDPVLYIWAGRPDKTADRVRELIDRNFNASRAGLPGNDDSGAMSSWFAFNAMGFYPNAGQDLYLIGTPSFSKVTIQMGSGKTFSIIAKNLDAERHNRYVQSATLNGLALNRAWFRHSEIKNGVTLVLNMGDTPSKWGMTNPPPSMSDPHGHQ